MAYKIVNNWLPSSKYRIKAPYAMSPNYLVIHNTANTASARNEVAYMIRNNNQTSYHVAIDDKEVVQAIPFNRNAWHTGDGGGINTGNRKAIGIEICYSMDNGYSGAYSARHRAAENNAAEYVAHVLIQYGWGVDRLRQHWHYTKKDCPHKMRAHNGWNAFKNKVQSNINRIKGGNSKPSTPKKTAPKKPAPKKSTGSGTGGAGNIKYKWNNWKTNRHGTHYVAVDATFVVGDTGIWPYERGPFIVRANRAPSIVKAGTRVKFYELRRQNGYVWGVYKTGSGRERNLPIKKWNGGGGRVTSRGLFGRFI